MASKYAGSSLLNNSKSAFKNELTLFGYGWLSLCIAKAYLQPFHCFG